jgi:hypothetical protein
LYLIKNFNEKTHSPCLVVVGFLGPRLKHALFCGAIIESVYSSFSVIFLSEEGLPGFLKAYRWSSGNEPVIEKLNVRSSSLVCENKDILILVGGGLNDYEFNKMMQVITWAKSVKYMASPCSAVAVTGFLGESGCVEVECFEDFLGVEFEGS